MLGPPGSGKSTLLKALAGKLQGKSPRVSGRITYNGETFDRFVPQRTAAYVSQASPLCPPLMPRIIWLPTIVSAHTYTANESKSWLAA